MVDRQKQHNETFKIQILADNGYVTPNTSQILPEWHDPSGDDLIRYLYDTAGDFAPRPTPEEPTPELKIKSKI